MHAKTVLITGGTSGVGLAAAREFLEQGATVIINGRSRERGAVALDFLDRPRAHFVAGDLMDPSSVDAVVSQVVQNFGGLDVLISAGAEGAVPPKPFAEMTSDELELGFTTRLLPRLYALHSALPALRERRGSVVMLTTDAARFATPGESIVGAVGASLILLTKTLGKEFSRWQVRVNSVAMTLTSGTASWDRIFSVDSFQNNLFTKLNGKFPSGQAPSAEEVANAVVFLASDRAIQITGQTLSVNGGLSFGGW